MLDPATVLDVLAQPDQTWHQPGVSCCLLGFQNKQEELRSVLIATAKSKGTGVCSIMTIVSYFGKDCSQKQHPVNWENAQSRVEEVEKVQCLSLDFC